MCHLLGLYPSAPFWYVLWQHISWGWFSLGRIHSYNPLMVNVLKFIMKGFFCCFDSANYYLLQILLLCSILLIAPGETNLFCLSLGTRIPPQNHMGNWGAPPEAPPMGQATASPVATPRTSDPPSQDAGSTQRRREYDAKIGKCMHAEGLRRAFCCLERRPNRAPYS